MQDDFSYNPERTVRPYLQEGEELLWVGQPYTTISYRPNPFGLLFSLFFFGFAIFWTTMASQAGLFALFGLPFLCVGGYMLYMALVGNANRMKRTVYAVTDRRAMIVSETARGVSCRDFFFSRLSSINLVHVQGTVGTIRFVPDVNPYDYGYGYGYGYRHRRRGMPIGEMSEYDMNTSFLMIDNVQEVYRLISEHRERS